MARITIRRKLIFFPERYKALYAKCGVWWPTRKLCFRWQRPNKPGSIIVVMDLGFRLDPNMHRAHSGPSGNLYCGHTVGLCSAVQLPCPSTENNRMVVAFSELLPSLFSLKEVEQELNRVACLCHFSSAVSVIVQRCGP